MQRKAPENTTKTTGLPGYAAMLMPPGAIEAQEAEGQRQLAESDTLPTSYGFPKAPIARPALEAAGVKFLGPVEGDELFEYVELPPGWKKKPTEHSMHTELIDQNGRKRAGIFYKAAFYDRRADINLCTRFSVGQDYSPERDPDALVCQVRDGERVIFATEPVKKADGWEAFNAQRDAVMSTATAWLAERYPDWESYTAYWDEGPQG